MKKSECSNVTLYYDALKWYSIYSMCMVIIKIPFQISHIYSPYDPYASEKHIMPIGFQTFLYESDEKFNSVSWKYNYN